jgi:hypothetical protein
MTSRIISAPRLLERACAVALAAPLLTLVTGCGAQFGSPMQGLAGTSADQMRTVAIKRINLEDWWPGGVPLEVDTGRLSRRIKSGKQLLYYSFPQGGAIEVFDRKRSRVWLGQIKDDRGPVQLFVDRRNRLWVANTGSSYGPASVWMFPAGSSRPQAEYTRGLHQANAVAVEDNGTVYVYDQLPNQGAQIVEYPPGSQSPSLKIHIPAKATWNGGLTLDRANDLYVDYVDAKTSIGQIVKFARGSKTGKNLGISESDVLHGLAFDPSGNLVVCSFLAINVYKLGAPSPVLSITGPVYGPEQTVYGNASYMHIGHPDGLSLLYDADGGSYGFGGGALDWAYYTEPAPRVHLRGSLSDVPLYGVAVSTDGEAK